MDTEGRAPPLLVGAATIMDCVLLEELDRYVDRSPTGAYSLGLCGQIVNVAARQPTDGTG